MRMEGYDSLEEHAQDHIELFLLLQKEGEAADFSGKANWIADRETLSDLFLPARFLRERCMLTETEYWLMMLAFCVQIEEGLCMDFRSKYQERQPTLQYGLHLISLVMPVDFELIGKLGDGRSMAGALLELSLEKNGEMLSLPLRLNPMVFYFLLTGGVPREGWYRVFLWNRDADGERKLLSLYPQELRRLCVCLGLGEPVRIALCGRKGSGKRTLLEQACRKSRRNAMFVSPCALRREETGRDRKLRTLRLLCRLFDPLIVLEAAGSFSEFEKDWAEFLQEGQGTGLSIVFLEEGGEEPAGGADVRISLKECLSGEEKKEALDAWLAPEERREWQEELLERYPLNIGELLGKQKTIRMMARERQLTLEDPAPWTAGLAEHDKSFRLGRLVERGEVREDLVLPEDCRRQLDTVILLAKNWSGGQGLSLLFHGSSGTGKTMAASILARQLGRPLFKVDLSRIYDKYIGETEKHIDKIFKTAQHNHYLLFFDEADILFGKRTGVQDSHDKYANLSTAYLLQRIEEYDGVLVLATNLMDQFDDAFVRRLRFVIKFRNLDGEGRKRLWEKVLAGGLPPAADVSLEELAQAAELSPARIAAAARVAGLLAQCDGSRIITRGHLWQALELEAGKDETAVKLKP